MTATVTPRFATGEAVTILVGSHAGDRAQVEAVVWSERDHCHYFYLEQGTKKLSRGYRADELSGELIDTLG